jgi:hypothetical protein
VYVFFATPCAKKHSTSSTSCRALLLLQSGEMCYVDGPFLAKELFMSTMKKLIVAISILFGATMSIMELAVLWYGEDGDGVQALLERTKVITPHRLEVSFDPSKVTYAMNDIVKVTAKVFDEEGGVISEKQREGIKLDYTSNRPFIRIEGDRILIKGTGKVIITGCIAEPTQTQAPVSTQSDSKPATKKICGEAELMVMDEDLPFD